MRKWFAVNHKCFPMAAEVVISLLLALLMGLTLSSTLRAQGPALTTISEKHALAKGWLYKIERKRCDFQAPERSSGVRGVLRDPEVAHRFGIFKSVPLAAQTGSLS